MKETRRNFTFVLPTSAIDFQGDGDHFPQTAQDHCAFFGHCSSSQKGGIFPWPTTYSLQQDGLGRSLELHQCLENVEEAKRTNLPYLLFCPEICALVTKLLHTTMCNLELICESTAFDVEPNTLFVQMAISFAQLVDLSVVNAELFFMHAVSVLKITNTQLRQNKAS